MNNKNIIVSVINLQWETMFLNQLSLETYKPEKKNMLNVSLLYIIIIDHQNICFKHVSVSITVLLNIRLNFLNE